jgi:proteasome lid subunit RPN8/RPN11
MSWNNLKELSNHGYDIGSHTFSHQWLVKLENEKLRKELDLADVVIKKKIGLDVKHFCYPYGAFNEQIRELVIGRYDTAVSTIQNFSKIVGAYSRQWVMYDTSLEQFKRLLIEPADQENPKWYNDIIGKLQKSIIISNSDREILIQHAKSKEPYESCAILIGEKIERGWRVIEVFLTENIEKSEINFTISPQEEFKIDEIAKQKNLEIVSIFHSHPTSEPIPSITDKKFMRVNPFPWIIYSGITNTMKAYSIDLELNDISIDVV